MNSNGQEPSVLSIIPVVGVPEVKHGDDIASLICEHFEITDYDVVVVTQKVVSKAEGRVQTLKEDDAAGFTRLVEREAKRILRRRGSLLITETRHGFICANAGIDRSNADMDTVVLLPIDPDRSARKIRASLARHTGKEVAVIITDTFGRVWRNGVTDVAIGVCGLGAVLDLRGTKDANGRELSATEICIADEIAGAADLVKPKSSKVPVVIVRGIQREHFRDSSIKSEVVRPANADLFR